MSWLDVLAGRGTADEKKKEEFYKKRVAVLNKMEVEMKKEDKSLEVVRGLWHEMQEIDKEEELYVAEGDRFCSKCGQLLRFNSFNWMEGYHIDGCPSLDEELYLAEESLDKGIIFPYESPEVNQQRMQKIRGRLKRRD